MTNKINHEQFHGPLANYLRTHRLKTGLTQGDVAALLRFTNRDGVSRHERQEKIPSLLTALSYEALYRVPVSEIFIGLAKTAELNVEAQLAEYKTFLGEQRGAGPRAASIARKMEWLSEERALEKNNS